MKKLNSILAATVMFFMAAFSANAQMVDDVNLENAAKAQYGENLDKAVKNMDAKSMVDANGCISFTKEISAPGMTKNELYVEMANWFVCNYDNSIQFADKEQGVIIAKPYVENIARSAGGFNAYDISICPTIRVNVSDGKVLVSYNLRDYNVMVEQGGGDTATGLAVGLAVATVATAVAVAASEPSHPEPTHPGYGPHDFYHHHPRPSFYHVYHPHHTFEDALLLSCIASNAAAGPSKDSETWTIANCYPLVKSDGHKKASGRAFAMANVYSNVVVNNIEAAISQCSLAYNK